MYPNPGPKPDIFVDLDQDKKKFAHPAAMNREDKVLSWIEK